MGPYSRLLMIKFMELIDWLHHVMSCHVMSHALVSGAHIDAHFDIDIGRFTFLGLYL